MKVAELMTDEVVTVGPETTLKDVASLLVEQRISGVPVVDDTRTVLGVVSEADIVVHEQGTPRGSRLLSWFLGGGLFEPDQLDARTAGEAMSSPAITIASEKEVFEAARSMTEHAVKRLPVVDDEGRLVGIVTRADLVKAFTRPDEDVAREIEEMAHKTLWIESEGLHLHVHDGDVHLSGKLERRSDAELLPRFVARVPGVVSVRSTLRWKWDDRKKLPASDPHVPVPPRTR
jgi:CBS domain-containing protein